MICILYLLYCRTGTVEMYINNKENLYMHPTAVFNHTQVSSTLSYNHSKGFYIGASLDSMLFHIRTDINLQFYGKTYEPREILNTLPPPVAAYPLYEALFKIYNEYCNSNKNTSKILVDTHVPTPSVPPTALKKKRQSVIKRRTSILI